MIHSFAPVADENARVLVLGTMPSVASLAAEGYYAHPRNAFWPLIHALWGANDSGAYPDRYAFLLKHGIALWDVLASCEREGSLDSAIRKGVPNPIPDLLARYPNIGHIFCNGTAARALLKRYFPHMDATRLPSTSPAWARATLEQKIQAWQVVRQSIEEVEPCAP